MTASEEDRALAEQCVLFSSYPIDEVVHAFATIRARAAAEVTERAAKIVERWSLPTIQTPSMWLIDKAGIAAAIRADLTAGKSRNEDCGSSISSGMGERRDG